MKNTTSIKSSLPVRYSIDPTPGSETEIYLGSKGVKNDPFPATLALYYKYPNKTGYVVYEIERNKETQKLEAWERMSCNNPVASKLVSAAILQAERQKNGGQLPDDCQQEFERLKKTYSEQPQSDRNPITNANKSRYKSMWEMTLNLVAKGSYSKMEEAVNDLYSDPKE